MAGTPDGLGAIAVAYSAAAVRYVADGAFFTVFMNHEFGTSDGIVRTHGQTGSFVSQWTVNLKTL